MLSVKILGALLLIFKIVSPSALPTSNADTQVEHVLEEAQSQYIQLLDQIQEHIWTEKFDSIFNVEAFATKLMNTTRDLYENLKDFSPEDLESDILKRALKRWTSVKYSALSERDLLIYLTASSNFEEKATVQAFCDYHDDDNCQLSYIPDIYNRIAVAKNADELQNYWQQWRNIALPDEKEIIEYLIEVYTKASGDTGSAPSSLWYLPYEEDTLLFELSSVIEQMRPLYQQLHAYIRFKLRQKFGEETVPKNEAIPQHLMDQIFVQASKGDAEIDLPYPDKPLPNITQELITKGYAPLRMFQVSDEFFNSLGMTRVPENFWTEKTKPSIDESHSCKSRVLVFSNNDIRIVHCSKVTVEAFKNAVNAMTRVHYQLEKVNTSLILGPQASPGFSDAMAKVVQLSMITPQYLTKMGMLKNEQVDDEFQINRLYKLALQSVMRPPTYFVYESLWVSLLNRHIEVDKLSKAYWDITYQKTGVKPPSGVSPSFILPHELFIGLDPVEPNTKNIFSEILGFQLYEELCKKAGQYQDDDTHVLSDCNLEGNEDAGKALKNIMSIGVVSTWREAIKPLIEDGKLNASSLVKYFEPLYLWLKEENARNGEEVGWTHELQQNE